MRRAFIKMHFPLGWLDHNKDSSCEHVSNNKLKQSQTPTVSITISFQYFHPLNKAELKNEHGLI